MTMYSLQQKRQFLDLFEQNNGGKPAVGDVKLLSPQLKERQTIHNGKYGVRCGCLAWHTNGLPYEVGKDQKARF